MKPTVGRIVLYTDKHFHQRAALITEVNPKGSIDLCVFFPDRIEFKQHIEQDDKIPGTWDWMDYQKGQAVKTEELENQMRLLKGGF